MFAGLIRTVATIVLVWFVFRWLDRTFGGSRKRESRSSGHAPQNPQRPSKPGPKDDAIGDYVDFEEIDSKD